MNKTQLIKKYLEDGGSLTNISAYEKFGTTRLGSIIHHLRKHGVPIVTIDREEPDRYGNLCRFAEYRLGV